MTAFKPNGKFKKEYNKLFKSNPFQANLFLLLCELANDKGEVLFDDDKAYKELGILMEARFNDPEGYAL